MNTLLSMLGGAVISAYLGYVIAKYTEFNQLRLSLTLAIDEYQHSYLATMLEQFTLKQEIVLNIRNCFGKPPSLLSGKKALERLGHRDAAEKVAHVIEEISQELYAARNIQNAKSSGKYVTRKMELMDTQIAQSKKLEKWSADLSDLKPTLHTIYNPFPALLALIRDTFSSDFRSVWGR